MTRWLGPTLLTGTAFLAIVSWLHGQPLVTGAAPYGGVSMQFARTLEVARSILASWQLESQLPTAGETLRLDSLFIVLYAALLIYASLWQRGRATGKWKTLAAVTAFLAALAGLLNAIGDVGQWRLLDTYRTSGGLADAEGLTLTTVYVSSTIKFLLIGTVIALLFVLDVRRVSADGQGVASHRDPLPVRPEDLM